MDRNSRDLFLVGMIKNRQIKALYNSNIQTEIKGCKWPYLSSNG
jgi:hypothetical protein